MTLAGIQHRRLKILVDKTIIAVDYYEWKESFAEKAPPFFDLGEDFLFIFF